MPDMKPVGYTQHIFYDSSTLIRKANKQNTRSCKSFWDFALQFPVAHVLQCHAENTGILALCHPREEEATKYFEAKWE